MEYALFAVYYNSMIKHTNTTEINFHIDVELYRQLAQLQSAGLSQSAVARLAIRKCFNLPLDGDVDNSFPKRLNLYLTEDDAKLLDELANRQGERSRAKTLRRLIATYLRTNASAIESLF